MRMLVRGLLGIIIVIDAFSANAQLKLELSLEQCLTFDRASLPIPQQTNGLNILVNTWNSVNALNKFPLGANQTEIAKNEKIKKLYADVYQYEKGNLGATPFATVPVAFDELGLVTKIGGDHIEYSSGKPASFDGVTIDYQGLRLKNHRDEFFFDRLCRFVRKQGLKNSRGDWSVIQGGNPEIVAQINEKAESWGDGISVSRVYHKVHYVGSSAFPDHSTVVVNEVKKEYYKNRVQDFAFWVAGNAYFQRRVPTDANRVSEKLFYKLDERKRVIAMGGGRGDASDFQEQQIEWTGSLISGVSYNGRRGTGWIMQDGRVKSLRISGARNLTSDEMEFKYDGKGNVVRINFGGSSGTRFAYIVDSAKTEYFD